MSSEGQQDADCQGRVTYQGQGGERDMASYLEDIRDIKNLLSANQEKPIVSPWAFHSWGLLILLGTLANLAAFRYAGLGFYKSFWWIWAPVMALGGVLESIGFIQVYRRQALVFSSPRVMKTYLGLWGLLGLGIIFMVFGLTNPWSYGAAGFISSSAFIVGGSICKQAKPAS